MKYLKYFFILIGIAILIQLVRILAIPLLIIAVLVIAFKIYSKNKLKNTSNTNTQSARTQQTSIQISENTRPREQYNTDYSERPRYDYLNREDYRYYYTDVNIYPHDFRDFDLIYPDSIAELLPEPSNTYDSNAVAVYCAGMKIGYLKKGKLQEMVIDFYYNCYQIDAVVSRISGKEIYLDIGMNKN